MLNDPYHNPPEVLRSFLHNGRRHVTFQRTRVPGGWLYESFVHNVTLDGTVKIAGVASSFVAEKGIA